MKVKEDSENVGSKLNIQKIKIIAFGPIDSWQTDREILETVTTSLFGSKIPSECDCSNEMKRQSLEGMLWANWTAY